MSDVAPEFVDPDADPTVEAEPELPPLEQSTGQLESLIAEQGDVAEDEEDKVPFIEHRGQKWHVVEALPAAVQLNLARLKDKKVPSAEKASIIDNVISYSVVEEERADFNEWLMSTTPIIEMEELMEILQKLVEKVVNHPTQ